MRKDECYVCYAGRGTGGQLHLPSPKLELFVLMELIAEINKIYLQYLTYDLKI
jgi:hypothetical protein